MTNKRDRHYPLGFWSGAREIQEDFGPEAEAIGVITILWSRHELALKDIFVALLRPQERFAAQVWDAQNTHRGRAKLLRIALDTMEISDKRRAILTEVLRRTAILAEKRNALAHGEYVLDMDQEALLARNHRPEKQPIIRPSDLGALGAIIQELEEVDRWVSAWRLDNVPQDLKDEIARVAGEVLDGGLFVPESNDH